jgi:hypothetical protein
MKVCSLSIAYACPYHHNNATMGLSVHNVNIRKPLAHTTVVSLVQLKHFSSVSVAIKGEDLPTEVGYDAELQSGQDPGEDNEHTDELP